MASVVGSLRSTQNCEYLYYGYKVNSFLQTLQGETNPVVSKSTQDLLFACCLAFSLRYILFHPLYCQPWD